MPEDNAKSGAADKTKKTDQQADLDPNSINVKIYSPFKIYFDGPAKSISAENDTGPFDILPKHHNFMTLLNAGEVTVVREGGEQKYRIARGIMHVKKNQVIVFLDV
ncbi:F0F1 ATP synthase subunit epsilon [Candidatus Saccharibacteria bacterium]|nr:F0F1 ATP synthase subunit epsilon [Candidatus Saccharibacteria bacterium]